MAQQNKNSSQPEGFGGFDDLISEFSEDLVMPPQAKPAKPIPASPPTSQAKPVMPAPPPAPPRNNPPKPSSPPPQAPAKPEVRVIVEPKPVPSSSPQPSESSSKMGVWFIAICLFLFVVAMCNSPKNQNNNVASSTTQRQPAVVVEPTMIEPPKTIIKNQDVKPSEVEIEQLRKSADMGNSTAMFNLGLKYKRGYNVPQDDKLADFWFKKAADYGNEDAKKALGKINQFSKTSISIETSLQSSLPTPKPKVEADPLVKEIQKKLLLLGYYPGSADGYIGQKTLNAIKQFQKDNRLPVDSKISEDLLKNLDLGQSHVDRQVRQEQTPVQIKPQSESKSSSKNPDVKKDQEKCMQIREEMNFYSSRMAQKNLDDIVGYDQAYKKYQQNCGKL